MKIAANLTWLFTELPLLDRPAAARRAGFDAVEVLFPFDTEPADLRRSIEAEDLTLELINTPLCDTKGRAAISGEINEFRTDFETAAAFATAAGAPKVHIMSGVTTAPDARDTLIENLIWAAAQAPDLGLTIEPLNGRDVPGYFLCDFFQAAEIIAETGILSLKLQFDTYHAQMIHGDAVEVWRQVGDLDSHVQIAEAPDRSEPGEKTFDALRVLRGAGYDGVISAEYKPRESTDAGLAWLEKARAVFQD